MFIVHKDNETLEFAKSELNKYCNMLDSTFNVKIGFCSLEEVGKEHLIDEKNSHLCDVYCIDIKNGCGIIAASNSRSIVLGVYRMLKEAGCRFIRPGTNGEYIPQIDLSSFTLEIDCKAKHDHRGITIEGSVSLENILDIVDWAPKVGFNSYFIQFRDGHEFFERWYKRAAKHNKEAETYTREDSARNTRLIVAEIKKRGMIYHAVGHGWNCEAIGIKAGGWHKADANQLPLERRELLALVNGKRDFFEGIPLNTQLCYSNPLTRKLIIDNVIEYVMSNTEVDILHFWLGDNFNNFCECDNCKNIMPADFYVMMLNEIDERLNKIGSDIKIVFLVYLELLWTPEKEVINNPDRFIMMFAPIHRLYTKSFKDCSEGQKTTFLNKYIPYERNKITFPRECDEYLLYLSKWKEVFKGDSFDFEYHLMWDVNRDFGVMRLPKVIYEDVQFLQKASLNGLLSCQQNRAFFPTGFAMYVMGNSLFDPDMNYDELLKEYFLASFGSDYRCVQQYLEGVSDLFSFEYNCNLKCDNDYVRIGVEKGILHIKNFILEHDNCKKRENTCHQASWDIIFKHAQIYLYVAGLLLKKLEGRISSMDEIESAWKETMDRVYSFEDELQPVLDFEYFNLITGGIMRQGLDN